MSILEDMYALMNRLPREVIAIRIEHASPDFIEGLRAKCTVVDRTLAGGSAFMGIPIVFNPKLPRGLVRTVMSDGAVLDQRVPLFTNPFAAAAGQAGEA